MAEGFSEEAREAVYAAIFGRRDVRAFHPDPVPEETLERLLVAAHHAPSVGFMQPWDFVVIRDREVRERVQRDFEAARQAEAERYDEPLRSKYLSMKLEGILDAPLNLCVTCDPSRGGPKPVLGRGSIPETDVYSTCLAVQNLWLAARAEGLGVGWVSIVSNDVLRGILGLPQRVIPVAYLCVGYPEDGFLDEPMLQKTGWRDRLSLEPLIHYDSWSGDEKSTEGEPD